LVRSHRNNVKRERERERERGGGCGRKGKSEFIEGKGEQ
jgi:hypothetical protein